MTSPATPPPAESRKHLHPGRYEAHDNGGGFESGRLLDAVTHFAAALQVGGVRLRAACPRRYTALTGVPAAGPVVPAVELYLEGPGGAEGALAVVLLPASDADLAYAVAWLGEHARRADEARRQALVYGLARPGGEGDWLRASAEVSLAPPPMRAAEDSYVRFAADGLAPDPADALPPTERAPSSAARGAA
jgi:hypothetical protein